jgi:hypothetical protein
MNKLSENKPYGPGNTFWYVDDDGEIMRCRWNDAGWKTRTFFNIRNEKTNSSEYEYLRLLKEAYESGMRDQLTIIQNCLGIKQK